MNEIRQLCTSSASPGEHLDEILALFHACPPQHLLSSLSLIGQSISCMSIEHLDLSMIHHPLFLLIRQWSERLLQQWLTNGTLNGEEYRAIFYIHQLFKLLSEWLLEQEHRAMSTNEQESLQLILSNLFLEENFLQLVCHVIDQLINDDSGEGHSTVTAVDGTTASDLSVSKRQMELFVLLLEGVGEDNQKGFVMD